MQAAWEVKIYLIITKEKKKKHVIFFVQSQRNNKDGFQTVLYPPPHILSRSEWNGLSGMVGIQPNSAQILTQSEHKKKKKDKSES